MNRITALTYDDLVTSVELTCGACPTIYEGVLKNGDNFYVRYRWGSLRFVNESSGEWYSREYRDPKSPSADGVLSQESFERLLPHLYVNSLGNFEIER